MKTFWCTTVGTKFVSPSGFKKNVVGGNVHENLSLSFSLEALQNYHHWGAQ